MRIIPSKETLIVEFKSDRKSYPDSELVEAIVGMTNTDGGVLYLGVEDDGTLTGVKEKHKDTAGVCAMITNKTVPPVYTQADIVIDEGIPVLEIRIPISKSVVATTDGKILRRRLKVDGTPENIPMYPYEINSRLSDLNLLDYSALAVPDATIEDFDPNERQRLREIIKNRKGDKTLLDLTDEELDKALRLVREEYGKTYPTITGLLLLGKENRLRELIPTARSSFQVLEGTKVRVNEQYAKPLLATMQLFEQYLKAWNPEREMQYGMFRLPIPEFSEDAFREAVVNAFCHRDYSVLQEVRVAIEDEGMTISNPGGFVEGVTLENLLTVQPHGRNQTLADALKRIGLAERTGRGIDRIYEGSIIFGRPLPDYSESNSRSVTLFIQRSAPDLPFAKMIANEENRLGRSLPINSLLILSTIRSLRRATLSDITRETYMGEARAKAHVEKLIESGLVEGAGNGKNRSYILSSSVYKEQDNIVGYVRQTGIQIQKYEELIIRIAEEQGYVTRDNVKELLNVSDNQAYRLLKKLSDKKRLVLIGNGRSSKYVVYTSK